MDRKGCFSTFLVAFSEALHIQRTTQDSLQEIPLIVQLSTNMQSQVHHLNKESNCGTDGLKRKTLSFRVTGTASRNAQPPVRFNEYLETYCSSY